MKVNENILREVLREAITDANRKPNTFEKQIKITMAHMYNMAGGEVVDILNGRIPVESMSDDTMFKVSTVLYELNKNLPNGFDTSKLEVDKYFTDNEKLKYNRKINREVIDEDIVFKQWIQVADDQFVVIINNKELARLVSINKIHYNPETQRNLTEIETKEGTIKKVTIISQAYNEICENMLNDDYIPDALSFNINPDLYAPPKIIRGALVVSKESVVDCIDGYHRLKSAIDVTKLNPNWEKNFIINLITFDVDKAKRFILQEDIKNHLSDEQKTQYDQDDAGNFIIDKLKQSMYLKNSNLSEIHFQLNKIINQIFKPQRLKNSDARKKAVLLYKTIETNMNDLIENNNYIGKKFTLEEWFIYLYLNNYCINNNVDFVTVLNKINMDNLLRQIKIVNKPIQKHYNIMSEVIGNV